MVPLRYYGKDGPLYNKPQDAGKVIGQKHSGSSMTREDATLTLSFVGPVSPKSRNDMNLDFVLCNISECSVRFPYLAFKSATIHLLTCVDSLASI